MFNVKDQFIEIKGDQYLDESSGKWICPYNHLKNDLYEAKHQCALANDVQIMYSAEYKKYLDYIDQKYGKGYLKQFKNSIKK